jgi:hypothetical protein
MQTGVKPKATDDPHDFVVVPSDLVRVAPSDAEITDLLRAAARHQSETGTQATSDPSVPTVDATFRATAVNDGVAKRGPSFGRRAMRAIAALLLTLGIGAVALSWQTFGYAAKKAIFSWAPKWAIAASLPLDKLGLAANSTPPDDPADAASAQPVAPASSAVDSTASINAAAATATAAPSSDTALQLQSMAHDLANANQDVETLKATVAELKAGLQQMSRDLAKVSEQAAKAKIAAAAPRPAVPAHRPAPVYSPGPAAYSPPPGYRPASSYPATQTAAAPAAQPYVSQQPQPYAPPPIPLQPEPGSASAPRPPMPVQ